MTAAEALAALRDIHVPPSGNSAALESLNLLPLMLLAALPILFWWMIRRRRNAWRRQALRRLDSIVKAARNGRITEAWQQLALVTRQLALHLDPSTDTASLTGEAWLARLDHLFATRCFAQGSGRALIARPYRRTPDRQDDSQINDIMATAGTLREALGHLNPPT